MIGKNQNLQNNSTNELFQDSMLSLKKEYLSKCYLLSKDLKELSLSNTKTESTELKINEPESNNLSLTPNYRKGVQLIYRPLDLKINNSAFQVLNPIIGKLEDIIYSKGIGHLCMRYYDQDKGIDIIIESQATEPLKLSGNNLIHCKDFNSKNYKDKDVIKDLKLNNGKDVHDVLKTFIEKYQKKDGQISRGDYSIKNKETCFQTSKEVLELLGLESDFVDEMYEKNIMNKYKKYEKFKQHLKDTVNLYRKIRSESNDDDYL
jgi:hypothetical protein